MFRFQTRLLLTHKIAAIAVIGVVGIALIGAIYLVGDAKQEQYRQIAARARSMFEQAQSLQAHLLQMRRVEADFLLRNNMGYANRFRSIEKEVRADIERVDEIVKSAKLDEVGIQLDLIRNGFDKYAAQFISVTQTRQELGLDANSGLQGSLGNSARVIEEKVREIDDPRLLSIVLMLRRHEKNFMLRNDRVYGVEMERTIEEMQGLLAEARMLPELKSDIQNKLAVYQKDFASWMNASERLAHDQLVMSEGYSEIDPALRWLISAANETYEQANQADQVSRTDIKRQMQIALLLIALAVCGLAFWIGRMISRPITAVTRSMGELAEGRNDIEIAGADRGDEIGAMARAVLVFRDAAVAKVQLESETAERRRQSDDERRRNAEIQAKAADEQNRAMRSLAEGLNRLAQGDLTFHLEDGFTDAYRQIKEDFNATVDQLRETVRAIALSTREVANTSAEISASTTDLSQRTEEQAASLEQTSASMEEMSAIVKKNAENAQEANQFATATRKIADQGGEIVGDAVSSMARIEGSSKKISDIIGVIDEIAFQTNLLALNAAVEAARAGDAGRGFAVVAAEVRNLAQRSSQAAKDIKELIGNSSDQVQEGVELVNRAGTALTDIVESVKKVADIVSEIASASAEQATGIDQINTALSQMDEVTQQNSALVEQNAASAKSLERQAAAMDEHVRTFRIDDAEETPLRRPVAAEAETPAVAKPQAPAPIPPKARANGRGPVGRMQTAVAAAFAEDPEWKEF
ncbi:MAG: HAMP domain-containing protein [Bradyrhizobiaceae bacterium]|nr:HAMP domain-containing protein [Bradyrhizobiaceae bacterium]